MKRDQLLQDLFSQTHAHRMRRMVEVGRASQTNPQLQKLLEELERGDWAERGLALQACYGSRDSRRAARGLTENSRQLRGLAARLVVILCTDAEAHQAVSGLPNDSARVEILRLFRRHRRTSIVDHWISRWCDEGNRAALALLPCGSPECVRRLFPAVQKRGLSTVAWRRLARNHPDFVLDILQERAAAAQNREAELLQIVRSTLPLLARHRPEPCLALIRVLLRHVSLGEIPLEELVSRSPCAVAELLLSSTARVSLNLVPVVDRLIPTLIERILRERPQLLPWPELWLRRLPVELRTAVIPVLDQLRDSDGLLSTLLLQSLPAERRQRECRAHWKHPRLGALPERRIPYATGLPFDEAAVVLRPYLRDTDADLRAAAGAALVRSIAFNRSAVPQLLEFLLARKNEQDPVRAQLLTAVAELPAPVWSETTLSSLGQVLQQAFDAADLSSTTASAAQRLILKLLPVAPAWSLEWLSTSLRIRGHLETPLGLEDRLNDRHVASMSSLIMPVLKAWNHRDRHPQLLNFAGMLGCRLKALPELIAVLVSIAHDATGWVAARALSLLRQHCHDAFCDEVPRLLKSDPSWITIPDVYQHLNSTRQDLLTPFLGQTAYSGRFSTGKTRFVLPVRNGFERWNPAQRQTFAATLIGVTRDSERDYPAQQMILHQLAALPDVPAASARLTALAHLRARPLALRDTALRALGRLDHGEGITALMSALGDDRARIALPALRRALLQTSTAEALNQLRRVPQESVTVTKEVARLIGDLNCLDAFEELLAWNGRDQHRDVRIALYRALWNYLDDDRAWTVFDQAALLADASTAVALARIPADGLPLMAQQRLARVLAVLLSHVDPRVRLKTLERCADLPIADPDQTLLGPLTRQMQSVIAEEVGAAAQAVFVTYVGRQAQVVKQVLNSLKPHRRALDLTLGRLQSQLLADPTPWTTMVDLILDSLRDDAACATWRVRLTVAGRSGPGLIQGLEALAGDLHAEALLEGVAMLRDGRTPHAAPDVWDAVAAVLGAHPDERFRRLGLAVITAQGNQRGWPAEARLRLVQYQADPSLLVSAAAQFTFPPDFPRTAPEDVIPAPAPA